MSKEQQILNTLATEGADVSEDKLERLVPVSEAIRYRKRAQAAEELAENLNQQLQEQQEQQQTVQSQLEAQRCEIELSQHLVKAGVMDLEVGLLLARRQVEQMPESGSELKSIVEQMQRERPHLFGGNDKALGFGGPTAGVRTNDGGGTAQLKLLADKAVHSGDRRDVQKYLRLRRSIRH